VSYCDEYVCLSACITRKSHVNFVNFLCSLLYGSTWLYLFLTALRYVISTSGFLDDVIFSHCGQYGGSCALRSGECVIDETTSSVPTKFCSSIKISK